MRQHSQTPCIVRWTVGLFRNIAGKTLTGFIRKIYEVEKVDQGFSVRLDGDHGVVNAGGK